MGADAGAAELRVDRAAIGLAGQARLPTKTRLRVPFAVASVRPIAFVRCGSLGVTVFLVVSNAYSAKPPSRSTRSRRRVGLRPQRPGALPLRAFEADVSTPSSEVMMRGSSFNGAHRKIS